MKSTVKKINVTDYFFGLLANLNSSSKRELIARLSKSLKKGKPAKRASLRDLYGSFISEKSADEIIAELRTSRNFTREREGL